MNIIQKYLRYTEEHEAKEIYHKWCIIGTIAACLNGRCWTTLGYDKLNPNFFIVLVGPPAWPRKSAAISTLLNLIQPLLAEGLITKAPESTTVRDLLSQLEKSKSPCKIDGDDHYYMSLYSITKELTNFLPSKDLNFADILLELFDGHLDYTHSTHTQGENKLEDVSLSILSATTHRFFESQSFSDYVRTGFSSRCIFIWLSEKRLHNPDPTIDIALKEEIQKDFLLLTKITGRIDFSSEGKKSYLDWYKGLSLTFDRNVPKDMISYFGRKQTYVRKLALILWSLDYIQEKCGREIESNHVLEAIDMIVEVERYMIAAYNRSGSSNDISSINDVTKYFQEHYGEWVSRKDLANLFSIRDMKPETLEYILNAMCNEMEVLEKDMIGTTVMYKWVGLKGE